MCRKLVLPLILSVFLGACTTAPVEEQQGNTSPSAISSDSMATPGGLPGKQEQPVAGKNLPPSNATDRESPVYTDIWQRIRDNLEIHRDLSRTVTQQKLVFYSRKQKYLDRVAERARPYLYYIVEELDKRNMPLDLALLPVVESAYQPFAYSRSRASGIWQFIPSTGRLYGLKQNWWYDGRRDIIAATDAALTYLQKLHQDFNGDWLLALAAYNAGENGIERAMENNRRAGIKPDFWSLNLKSETRNYVPSFLAVAEIVANPELYNISLSPIENNPYFSIVDIGGQIDLSTVSELSGMTLDELRVLNPGINKWATDPDGPHHLLIPVGHADTFERKLAALPPEQRVKYQVHHIKPGDSLGKIARQYNTDVTAIKRANKLKSNLIRAGHTLVIPAPGQPENQDLAMQTTLSPDNGIQAANAHSSQYTVRKGDSLWKISHIHGVTVEQICAWNGIDKNHVLTPGKILRVNGYNAAGMIPAVAHIKSGTRHVSYTVKPGDSLWQISRKFNVTVEQLQKWNSLQNPSAIKPGQSLDIYTGTVPADA